MSEFFAIIPVKPLDEGKSRLQGVLNAADRLRLNMSLMRRTFDEATVYPGVIRTIVVSRSASVLNEARLRGMHPLSERGCDLNGALALATRRAMRLGAFGLVVWPVDLPIARGALIRRIAECCGRRSCLLVPDRHGTGTNLMVVSPACQGLYRFGPDSFRRHRALARARGLHVGVVHEKALAIDVDNEADYRLWRSLFERGLCPQS